MESFPSVLSMYCGIQNYGNEKRLYNHLFCLSIQNETKHPQIPPLLEVYFLIL